jgi:hypothetical protein
MKAVLLAPPERRWECSSCPFTDVTRQHGAHTRMHPCAGLGGLTTPMVPAGTSSKVEVREREDYIAGDLVQLHNGRPVMSVTVTRDEGTDAVVFAPTATAHRS